MTFDAMSNSPSHSQLNTWKIGRRIWEFIRSHLRLFSRHPCNYSMVIICSYPASPRRITVLVNFQAILLILRVKPSQIVTFSLPKTPRKNFYRPPKFQHKKFAISFSLLILVKLNDNGSYHGLREPSRKLENHYPELKIY